MPTILFFGDSLCAGSDVAGGGPADAWPNLWAAGPGAGWMVLNRSRGGRPTAALDEFAQALVGAPAGALLVLALGTNDSRSLEPDMVERAVGNLQAMLDAARRAGISRAIIVAPPDVNPDRLGPTFPIRHQRVANLVRLEDAYRALAARSELGFLALRGVLAPDTLVADGVHPDPRGNRMLAAAFAAYLPAFLEAGSVATPKT